MVVSVQHVQAPVAALACGPCGQPGGLSKRQQQVHRPSIAIETRIISYLPGEVSIATFALTTTLTRRLPFSIVTSAPFYGE